MNLKKIGLLIVTIIGLTACANNAPKTQYDWGNYNLSLYSYFKEGDIAENISLIEKDILKNEGSQKQIAPGVHAHLGLLYAKNGDTAKAYTEFETEKRLYPDSSHFMNYLLKNRGAR